MSQSPHAPLLARLIVGAAHEPFVVLDLELNVLEVNAPFCRLLDVSRERTIGRSLLACAIEWDTEAVRELLEVTLGRQRAVRDRAIQIKSGATPIAAHVNACLSEPDRIIVLAIRDVRGDERVRLDLERHNDELRDRREELSSQVLELTRQLQSIEGEERRRLAEVLHDDIQQRLYGIGMHVSLASQDLAEGRYDAADEELDRIDAWLEETVGILRNLAVELNPPILATQRLYDALEWLAGHMEERHGLEVELNVEDVQASEEMRTLLERTTRELLFNVVKHAGVHKARVRMNRDGEHVVLTVSDDGDGFDPDLDVTRKDRPTGLGIYSITKRLKVFGGSLSIDSVKGNGTRVTVRLPAV